MRGLKSTGLKLFHIIYHYIDSYSLALPESVKCLDEIQLIVTIHFCRHHISSVASSLLENRDGDTENLTCMIKNLDDGTEYVVDKLDQEGKLDTLRVLGSNQLISFEEFHKNIGPSSFVRRHLQRDAESTRLLSVAKKKMKKGWLSKLDSIACFYHNQGFDETCRNKDFDSRIHSLCSSA